MNPELKEALEVITKRLSALEAIQEKNSSDQKVQQPVSDSDNIASDDNIRTNGVSTQPSEATFNPLDLGSDSACARDNLKEFDQIRERLAKVSLPNELKVNDNSSGIKTECRPTLKVIAKSARFAETNLKQLFLLSARINNGSVQVTEQELENLFIISAANIQFAQAEYANIVVKNSFDEETARLFKAFENHSSAFPNTSLNSLRVAAELSAARDRSTQRGVRGTTRQHRHNSWRFPRGRGRSDFRSDWQTNRMLPNSFNNQPQD